jgi:hypothetical protein
MDDFFVLLGAIPVIVVALYLCVKLIKKAFPFVLNTYAEPPLKSNYKKTNLNAVGGTNWNAVGGFLAFSLLILFFIIVTMPSYDAEAFGIFWVMFCAFIWMIMAMSGVFDIKEKEYRETSSGKEYVDINKEKSGGIIYKDISPPSSKKNK